MSEKGFGLDKIRIRKDSIKISGNIRFTWFKFWIGFGKRILEKLAILFCASLLKHTVDCLSLLRRQQVRRRTVGINRKYLYLQFSWPWVLVVSIHLVCLCTDYCQIQAYSNCSITDTVVKGVVISFYQYEPHQSAVASSNARVFSQEIQRMRSQPLHTLPSSRHPYEKIRISIVKYQSRLRFPPPIYSHKFVRCKFIFVTLKN